MIIIRQKEFARRDYEGLTEENAAKLRAERSRLAKELKNRVRSNQAAFGPMTSDPGDVRKLKLSNGMAKADAHIQSNQIRNDLLKSQEVNNPKSLKTGLDSFKKLGQEKLSKSNFLGKINPKTALGVGGAVVAGIGAKKLYDMKKSDEDRK